MNYRELQAKLSAYKDMGLTCIRLNTKYDLLMFEYQRIVEKLENEQSAKESEVITDFAPPEEITEELINNSFRRSDSIAILTLLGFLNTPYYLKSLRQYICMARSDIRCCKFDLKDTASYNEIFIKSLKTAIYIAEKALNLDNIKLRRKELTELKRQEKIRSQQTAVKNNFFNSDNVIFSYVH
jgi:hypothetical protein